MAEHRGGAGRRASVPTAAARLVAGGAGQRRTVGTAPLTAGQCPVFAEAGRLAGQQRLYRLLNDGGGGGPRNRLEVLERYGVHADYEEARWGANKVRRYVLRAVTHLFAGEHNAKRYRIALDEIVASIPKSRRSGGGVDRQ